MEELFYIQMFNCKVGIVSQIKNGQNNVFFIVGEFYTKYDKSILYKIHCELSSVCSSIIDTRKSKITIDNDYDLQYFRKKYKIIKRNILTSHLLSGIYYTKTPQLYDLDCMVPIFHGIKLQTYTINNIGDIFIILPCENPVIRAGMLNTCIQFSKGSKSKFYTFGGMYNTNKKETCLLARRYLIEKGIYKGSIIPNLENSIIHFLKKIILALNFEIIYVVSPHYCMSKTLNSMKRELCYSNRVRFLCD